MPTIRHAAALLLLALLAGCDLLGIDSPEKVAALKEGEGKAVGSACRHANRAIEDCYVLNPRAQKAAVFAGWREMDEYMRENKLEAVIPSLGRSDAKGEPQAHAATDGSSEVPKGAGTAGRVAPATDGKALHAS